MNTENGTQTFIGEKSNHYYRQGYYDGFCEGKRQGEQMFLEHMKICHNKIVLTQPVDSEPI